MANKIDEDMLDYISILAKLELEGDERRQARADMEKLLDYIDMLGELDTEGVEPLVQVNELQNVFRSDEITNGNDREAMLKNAPEKKQNMYVVPRTI